MAAPTNSERIESNTLAIRSVERSVAVHEERLKSQAGHVRELQDGHATLRESSARMDERVKHLERAADRTWRPLLTTLGALGALIVGLILQSLSS